MLPYLQTTSFTTAAASLLSILHHYKPDILLNRENEFAIWKETITPPTRASSIYALARYAQKHGLKPKIFVGKKEYDFPDYRFYRYTKGDIEHAAFAEWLHLQQAEQEQIPIEIKQLSFADVEREILAGDVLLLRVNVKPLRQEKRNASNFIVVYGYEKEHFQIIDPVGGASCVPKALLQEAFESLSEKKYRDKRMVVFPRRD